MNKKYISTVGMVAVIVVILLAVLIKSPLFDQGTGTESTGEQSLTILETAEKSEAAEGTENAKAVEDAENATEESDSGDDVAENATPAPTEKPTPRQLQSLLRHRNQRQPQSLLQRRSLRQNRRVLRSEAKSFWISIMRSTELRWDSIPQRNMKRPPRRL